MNAGAMGYLAALTDLSVMRRKVKSESTTVAVIQWFFNEPAIGEFIATRTGSSSPRLYTGSWETAGKRTCEASGLRALIVLQNVLPHLVIQRDLAVELLALPRREAQTRHVDGTVVSRDLEIIAEMSARGFTWQP